MQNSDTDDGVDHAIKARTLAVNAQDIAGQAKAMHKQSLAHANSGSSTDALRVAEKSEMLFRKCGDQKGEVDALLAMSESKVSTCGTTTAPAAT